MELIYWVLSAAALGFAVCWWLDRRQERRAAERLAEVRRESDEWWDQHLGKRNWHVTERERD